MAEATPIYRVRWTLRATLEWSLHSHQNAILYALLSDAARGGDAEGPTGLPDRLLLDAPERCRDRVEAGESFAFGATLLEFDPGRAAELLGRLNEGLVRLGRVAPRRPVALGGNFDLIDVRDLVAARALGPGDAPEALGMDAVGGEIRRLNDRGNGPLTLRFLSPLRLERPAAEADDGHRFADASAFEARMGFTSVA